MGRNRIYTLLVSIQEVSPRTIGKKQFADILVAFFIISPQNGLLIGMKHGVIKRKAKMFISEGCIICSESLDSMLDKYLQAT